MTYYDLGAYTRPITTKSPEAQVWFDRGLNWVFAFNHEEAIACFGKALEHDPGCAMAHWGIAYAAGPNYNLPWHLYDPAGKAKALAAAYDAMQAALACLDRATPVEQALIRALPARYPQREPIEDQSAWDAAFTEAMRTLFKANRDDLEVRCVFVEAIMNETPWQMWDLSTGGVAEGAGTAEAVEVLEEALNGIPAAWDHPGLLHLYVHLMEMSPFPQRALRAGDRLRDLVPDAGHLIHMPTHIDVLCGHYRDVVVYNQKAIVADRKFLARQGPMNVYALYRTHNHHFAIYGAMFLGQYTPAIQAAEELIATTPEALLRIPSPPMADFIEGYIPMKQHVLVRFGRWREILDEELPEDRALYCSTTAMMLYAKTVAHSTLGNIAEAEKTRTAFLEAKARVPETPARPQQHRRRPARHRRGDAERRARISSRQLRLSLRPSAPLGRSRRRAALRRAVGLDAAGPPCAGRPAAGAGTRRRSGGGLPRRSRLRRHAQPGVPASRECLEPARPLRMPDAPQRQGRGAPDQDPAGSGAGAR